MVRDENKTGEVSSFFDDISKDLLFDVAGKLLKEIDKTDAITMREMAYTEVTRMGKQVQVQVVVTDVKLMEPFVTEYVTTNC